MSDILMLIFTGVIAGATVVYAYLSYSLWKATKKSADTARFLGFMNLYTQFHNWLEEAKLRGDASVPMLESIERLLAELGIEHFLKGQDLKKNAELVAYFRNIEGMIRANGGDPDAEWWYRPIKKRLDR